MNRAAADLLLDDIDALIAQNAASMPDDEFLDWFTSEVACVVDTITAADREHVRVRMQSMLASVGKGAR